MGPGGKGANASVALARLGATSYLVGRIGDDDFGRREREALEAEGVRLDGVSVDVERHTGTAFIMVDDEGENTILVAIGANEGLTVEVVMDALAPHWSELDALLVNFEIPTEVVQQVVEKGAEMGVPVVVDAGPPREHPAAVWQQATVLSPNMLETGYLVEREVKDMEAAKEAAHEILAQGPEAVVIKMGAKGALLVTEEEELWAHGYEVNVVDTTGAGDAFTSALTMGVAEGRSLAEAVRRANASGALAVTQFGTLPAMPTRDEVEAFLRQTEMPSA
jgi:ribokinase